MNASTVRLCNALWTAGNSEGRGFAPYTDVPGPDTVDAAVEAFIADGWTLEHARNLSDEIAILSNSDGEYVGVGGDAQGNGAWAVNIAEYAIEERTGGGWRLEASADRYDTRDAAERAMRGLVAEYPESSYRVVSVSL